MKRSLALAAFFTAVAALVAAPLAAAQSYAGKTVSVIVGFKPGGGYDAVARVLARHLSKHLPGQPNVIVQNMPGGNSIIAANYLYNIARPDGLTLGTFNRNLPIAQLTGVAGVKFDMLQFAWIGSVANETTILAIRSELPYKSFDELRKAKEPVIVGSTGPGANTYDFPLLLKDLLGVNLKIVSGYSSSADIMLAVERKEVEGRAGSYTSLRPFIDRGLVRPVIAARSSSTTVKDLPVDESFAPSPRAKAIMALRSAPEQIARPFVLPPGTPAPIVKLMREAFAATLKDPALLAEGRKAQLDFELTSADEALKVLREVFGQPKDVVEEFSKYVKFGE
jgi:tripartite-type tricarboxylate transporter receptor subunit TctC